MSPHGFVGRGRYNSTQFPEVLPEEEEQTPFTTGEHVNVLAFNEFNGEPVNIDYAWPVIPEGVEVQAVWEPWGQPNGQYVDWDPYFLMPWPVDESSQNSDESQQTQQAGFD